MTLDARPNVLHRTAQSGTQATPQQQPNVLRTGLTLDRDRVLRPPAGRARGAIQLRPHISDLPDQVRHLTPQLGVAKRSALDAKDTGLDRAGAMIRKDGHPPPKVWCHVEVCPASEGSGRRIRETQTKVGVRNLSLLKAKKLSAAIEQHADRRPPGQGPQRYGKVAATSLHGCACSSADRALASGARGHRFKSCQARQSLEEG
jgi:hypothetical protein